MTRASARGGDAFVGLLIEGAAWAVYGALYGAILVFWLCLAFCAVVGPVAFVFGWLR